MKNYAIFLEGNNFLMEYEGIKGLCGFFITKRIEAISADAAGKLAVQSAWQDPRIAGQENGNPMPSIEVKVIHELPASIKMRDTDYTIFEIEAE